MKVHFFYIKKSLRIQYNNKASISTVSTINASPFPQLAYLQRSQVRQEQLSTSDLSRKIYLSWKRFQQGQYCAID